MRAEILNLTMTPALLVQMEIKKSHNTINRVSDCRGLICEWSYLYFSKGRTVFTGDPVEATHVKYGGKCWRLL